MVTIKLAHSNELQGSLLYSPHLNFYLICGFILCFRKRLRTGLCLSGIILVVATLEVMKTYTKLQVSRSIDYCSCSVVFCVFCLGWVFFFIGKGHCRILINSENTVEKKS